LPGGLVRHQHAARALAALTLSASFIRHSELDVLLSLVGGRRVIAVNPLMQLVHPGE
jgi:hypothetical protein